MATDNQAQSLSDKKYQYFGSQRVFYSGLGLGSTTAFTFLPFSGTNTGFGLANSLTQRICIAASGTSFMQWSYKSGTSPQLAGEIYADALAFDGVNVSGIWVRSKAASQHIRIWAW